MRPALRLLAAVQKNGATYLEAGAPTGLTGVVTSAAPRSTLLFLYNATLQRLADLPESSVYRASTEALTRHRLNIIEQAKPAGLAEWQARVKDTVDAHPDAFARLPVLGGKAAAERESNIVNRLRAQQATRFGPLSDEYDEQSYKKPKHVREGPRDLDEIAGRGEQLARDPMGDEAARVPEIEPEPALTAEQIGAIENEIGAGLIEEVIDVAIGELKVVETMLEHKAWEDLEEKPVEGQWTYFQRDSHVPPQ